MRTKMIWKVMRKGEDIYMNMESFGKKISSMRQNANMTQEELALRMGGDTAGYLQMGERTESPGYFYFYRDVQGVERKRGFAAGTGEKR